MRYSIWVLLFFGTNSLFAQVSFSGKISSSNNNPVSGATIVLVKKNNSSIH
jgi:hypothetical protein